MSTFEGFTVPQKNYFHMPNNWTDITAEIKNLAELKVVEYIMRHTWGYQEYGVKKAITTDEFMYGRKRADESRMDKGTGLSNRSVIDGLRAAEEHGYIESDLDDSDGGRKVKTYALKMQPAEGDVKNLHSEKDEPDVKNVHSRYEEPSQQTCRTFTSGMKNVHSRYEENTHRSEKNTLEKNLQKDTREKQGGEKPSKSESPPQSTPSPENSPSEKKSSYSELRKQWIAEWGPYGDAKWDNDALRWIAEQGGSFDDIKLLYEVVSDKRPEKIKNAWYRLSALKKPARADVDEPPEEYDVAAEFASYRGINEKFETRGVNYATV